MGKELRRWLAAALLVAGLSLAAACSSGGTGGQSASSPVAGQAERGPADSAARGGSTDAGSGSARVKAVVETGTIALVSADPDRVRQRIEALLTELGGTVDNEDTSHAPDGTIERSTLVLRVPAAAFGAAVDRLEQLGKVKTSTSSSRDVTTQLIDVKERVQTLRNSIDRLQRFQRRARDAATLIRYEQEITDRQGELHSLVAQREYLAGQAAMATLTVYLSTPARYVPPPDALRHAGFLAGLEAGWHALVDAVVVVLTVVGAVLPFGVVLAALGVPVWLLVRRARARRTAAAGSD
jgi:hypothetical protein